jgi:hypothetical protein
MLPLSPAVETSCLTSMSVCNMQVGQALSLSNPNPAAWTQASAAGSGGHLLVPDCAGAPHNT